MAHQVLLKEVDLIDRQRDELAIHIDAHQNDRTGQIVLARQFQHLRRVVAEQQRAVGDVQVRSSKQGRMSGASSSVMTVSSISGAMAAK